MYSTLQNINLVRLSPIKICGIKNKARNLLFTSIWEGCINKNKIGSESGLLQLSCGPHFMANFLQKMTDDLLQKK